MTTWLKSRLNRRSEQIIENAQRAFAAAKLANVSHGGPRDDLINGELTHHPDGSSAITAARAAYVSGTSRATLLRAKRVLQHGLPELVKATKLGYLSINEAYQLSKKSQMEQATILLKRLTDHV